MRLTPFIFGYVDEVQDNLLIDALRESLRRSDYPSFTQ